MTHEICRRNFARIITNLPLNTPVSLHEIAKQARLRTGQAAAYLREAIVAGAFTRTANYTHNTQVTYYTKIKPITFNGDTWMCD